MQRDDHWWYGNRPSTSHTQPECLLARASHGGDKGALIGAAGGDKGAGSMDLLGAQLQIQLEEVQGEVHQQHVQQEYCGSSVSKLWLTLLTLSDPAWRHSGTRITESTAMRGLTAFTTRDLVHGIDVVSRKPPQLWGRSSLKQSSECPQVVLLRMSHKLNEFPPREAEVFWPEVTSVEICHSPPTPRFGWVRHYWGKRVARTSSQPIAARHRTRMPGTFLCNSRPGRARTTIPRLPGRIGDAVAPTPQGSSPSDRNRTRPSRSRRRGSSTSAAPGHPARRQ